MSDLKLNFEESEQSFDSYMNETDTDLQMNAEEESLEFEAAFGEEESAIPADFDETEESFAAAFGETTVIGGSGDVPTKVSQLENDAGYITQDEADEKDLTIKTALETQVKLVKAGIPTKLSQLENDTDFGNYESSSNKPSIEGVTLIGDKTFPELNLNEEENATILECFNTVFGS